LQAADHRLSPLTPVKTVRRAARIVLVAGFVIAALVAAAGPVSAQPAAVPRLAHVVVVVFENEERGDVLGAGQAPTFDRLAGAYAQATDYRGVAHPSLPNYLALISGSTHGVTNDCTDCPQSGPTIGTELTRAGRTWAAYAEGYPSSPRFAKRHEPFLYFPDGASHVHGLDALQPSALPAFAFVTPDLCHDAHDCSLATADSWLKQFVSPLLRVPRTAVFIVFDEGTSDVGGGGVVPMIAAGTAVKPHARYTPTTNHYGLLRTIEDALGVPPLGAAAHARPLTGIWR
jgi:hypothetical protein